MGFALIIKLILIGIMLISAISYMIQRAGNKQNLKHAINTNPSTRQLTDEELLLLKPYLDDKELVKPYKYQPELVSRDVTAIEGECIRHSTTTNGTETSYYFTIGGIEVFMPYGMEGYTMTYNVAEVVFTKQYAFVISLNGYTLFTAKSERDLEDKLDEQWHNGIRGDFKKLSDQELAEIRQTELTSEIKPFIQQAQNRRCQILEQRDETRLEQASKSTLNTGFLSAVFLVLTFIFAINYKDNDLLLLIISLICLVLSVVFYFKRFKVEPRKINRVRGTIEVKNSEDLELCIGDNLLVTYPKYWDSLLPEKTTIETEFDVTVGSKQLLKYGHHCSIANEIDHYGSPKFWGRNCFLFIVGFILTLFLFFFSSSIKSDIQFSYHYLFKSAKLWMINDAKSLQQSDLKSGDEIDLSLVGASCKASHYQTRCDKVFINLFQVDLSVINNQFPKWIDQLIKGDLVQVKQNSETKQLALYSRMINGGKNNIDYVKIMNAEQLIFIINELCETNNNASCTRLKYIFSILFTDQQSNEIDGWNNLVEYAQENPKHVIALSSTVSEIISKLSILSQDILEKKEQLLFEELDKIQQQPTSIILSFTDNQWLNVSIPGNYSINSYDIHKRILYYQTLLSEASGQTQINGIIDHVINDDNGTIKEIVINPEPRYRVTHYTVAPEILIETILFFIVTIFTLIQLIILLIKMRFNCKRSQQIKIHYSNLQY